MAGSAESPPLRPNRPCAQCLAEGPPVNPAVRSCVTASRGHSVIPGLPQPQLAPPAPPGQAARRPSDRRPRYRWVRDRRRQKTCRTGRSACGPTHGRRNSYALRFGRLAGHSRDGRIGERGVEASALCPHQRCHQRDGWVRRLQSVAVRPISRVRGGHRTPTIVSEASRFILMECCRSILR